MVRTILRFLGWVLAVGAFGLWSYGIYTVLDGDTQRGLVLVAVGAWILLMLAWIRGAPWLPEGGGTP